MIGLDGSTAMTATERSAARTSAIRAATSVDFPDPGGPVIPTRCARPADGYSRRSAASATGVRFSTAVSSRASAESVARNRGVAQRGGPPGGIDLHGQSRGRAFARR